MNEPENVSERLRDLIDDYLSGPLDDARLRELEECLREDAEARRYFVRYARLHTDLHLEMRARKASERSLDRIEHLTRAGAVSTPSPEGTGGSSPSPVAFPKGNLGTRIVRQCFAPRVLAAAACLLLVLGAGWWLVSKLPFGKEGREPAIAWLVNAQNCQWSDEEPTGDMQAGKLLNLERGLAEIHFQCGARVVLEGPAKLELLSGKSARLTSGKLTARVPAPTMGFEVLSPQGKVIDLGTEFGLAIGEDGAANVYVFEGKVEAHAGAWAGDHAPAREGAGVSLTQNQAARIADGQVTLRLVGPGGDAGRFVRAIVPPPVVRPRTLRLTFDCSVKESIRAADGSGTGLTHRLPGTGAGLPEKDSNLRLNTAKGQLELTTTNSDLNTQYKLHHGEYLGVRLSNLGFTGKEDFAVTAILPNIPALEIVGQFGLYAGAWSDNNIRGGVIGHKEPGQYTQFLVNNKDGKDDDIYRVGLLSTGADLRLTLKRIHGEYSLTVENLTAGSSSTLAIRHPEFLDKEPDLYVGLFGANTQSEVRKTLTIKEFSVTVWTVSPKADARN